MWDKWENIRCLSDKNKKFITIDICNFLDIALPKTTFEANDLNNTDKYNHYIYIEIIKFSNLKILRLSKSKKT